MKENEFANDKRSNMLYRWKQQQEQRSSKKRLTEDERAELNRLQKEVKHLRMEKAILKKAHGVRASMGSVGACWDWRSNAFALTCHLVQVFPERCRVQYL